MKKNHRNQSKVNQKIKKIKVLIKNRNQVNLNQKNQVEVIPKKNPKKI